MTRALRRYALVTTGASIVLAWSGSAASGDTGPWVWPLSPEHEVAAGFDPPDGPWAAGHRGADLSGFVGQQVAAMAAGQVVFAGVLAGRGVVVVRHGALRSTYEPVTATVAVGEVVAAGAVIGLLQVVQSHCLPLACLHVGLRRGDTYLDPLTRLGPVSVRLKPWWGLDFSAWLPPAP